MNVLITGAAGFIGFHLAKYLKKKNCFVIGLDNFNSYYDVSLKKDREKNLNEDNIEIIEGDIRDIALLKKIIQKNKVTHVVHLAAQAGVRYSFSSPMEYVESNLTGFVSLLEAIKPFEDIKYYLYHISGIFCRNESNKVTIRHKNLLAYCLNFCRRKIEILKFKT
jgi:UDP-glucuronate 4-epimerase